MQLIREHWTTDDGIKFQEFLLSKKRAQDKCEWEKRIINTQMDCLAIISSEVEAIVKEISKGNYKEFIDLWLWDYYTNTSIIGKLICKIKDFEVFNHYLDIYASKCDNWATCDCLKLNVNEKNKPHYFDLAKRYILSTETFTRRIGNSILFKFVDDDRYIGEIFELINSQTNENEYYVNMILAWLVAECFVKQRDKTVEFLKTNKLNAFTANKAVSKCRDSFRVTKEDKEFLLKYKRKQ